jgi:hypothetical protein
MDTGRILIGIGAGFVSALLLATIASGNALAMVLVCLSPLPLVIVGLGWSWVAAIAGSLVASIALAMVTAPAIGLVYFLGVGAPAAWLSYAALLGRPASESTDPEIQRAGGTEWYPIGRIVAWLAILAALLATVFVLQFGLSVDDFLAATKPSTEASLRALDRLGFRAPPAGPQFDQLVRFMSLMVPVVIAATAFLVLVFNIWLGGKIVARSGRSPRPWPDVATFELPRFFVWAYLAALVLTFVGPGLISVIAGFFAISFTLAYALQGLAVLHFVTRGLAARFLILTANYIVLFVFSGAIVILAVLGLVEPMFKLRARAAARRKPPFGGTT